MPRTGDERESRAVVVSLTDAGMRVLPQAQGTHHRNPLERLFSRFSPDELAQLEDFAARVLADGDD